MLVVFPLIDGRTHIHAVLLEHVNCNAKTVVKTHFAQEIKLIARATYLLTRTIDFVGNTIQYLT